MCTLFDCQSMSVVVDASHASILQNYKRDYCTTVAVLIGRLWRPLVSNTETVTALWLRALGLNENLYFREFLES